VRGPVSGFGSTASPGGRSKSASDVRHRATDTVAYPIADRRELLVAKIYQDIHGLPPDPARAVYGE